MPSDPTGGRPTAGGPDRGAPAPRPGGPAARRPGPGRAVRATRALVAAVLALLVLATVITALLGHAGGAPEPEGAPAAPPSPAPVTVAGLPPLLPPLDDLAGGPGATGSGAPPTGAGIAAALAPLLADPALGPRVALAVADATTGELLLDLAPAGEPGVIPASTSKIVTAAAALTALDPASRLSTRVVEGAAPGEIVLVGGGDPTLAGPQADPGARIGGEPPARLAALADATAQALAARADAGAGPVTVTVDASLFGPAELAPGWKPSYLSDGHVAPVVALSVDAGRVRPGRLARHPEPDLAAGQAFAALLAERGVAVAGVARGAAPAEAVELAAAQSPPVADLVEEMLAASDNDLAEALGRHVALALGEPPTAAGAARALREAVAGLGVPAGEVAVADASGLSRDSRVTPAAVAGLLAAASSPGRPELRPVVTGLPVAGFSGTLAERYRGAAGAGAAGAGAAGDARAKTGTLSGVSALAGVVVDAEGRLLAFDVTADAVPSASPRGAEAALDRLVAALAACGCA